MFTFCIIRELKFIHISHNLLKTYLYREKSFTTKKNIEIELCLLIQHNSEISCPFSKTFLK
jgi:hypothetical protein